MSLYLYQNDKQSGPFSEEQVRQMVQAGLTSPQTLAWREGMGEDWVSLTSLLHLGPLPGPRPPAQGKPILGIVSLAYGGVSAVGWVILFIIIGMRAAQHDKPSETATMLLGFVILGGIALNGVAMVLGIIGAFQNRGRALSIGGACLNALAAGGILLLILLGIAVGAHHSS